MQILDRHLAIPLHRAMQEAAVVALTGVRGAGKTTLARREFPGHRYVTLAEASDRRRARENPRAFLGSLRGPAVVDEAQRAPELLAGLPEYERPGQLLLIAPWRLGLATELHLYPLSLAEREQRPARPIEVLARYAQPALPQLTERIPVAAGARDYDALAADGATVLGLRDADRFVAFAERACAVSGSVVDQSALAREAGVTHTTIARWLAALERMFRVVLLPPFEEPHGRRLVKRKKLYALDTAWAAPAARFASWCAAEVVKNAGGSPLRHWTTATGLETGLVVLGESGPLAVSFTALPGIPAGAMAALEKWRRLGYAAVLVQGGAAQGERTGVRVYPWWWL